MRSGLKSFVKVMDLVDAGTSSVEFRDTTSSAIPCNYFSVQCRNVSGMATFPEHGYFFISPSAGGHVVSAAHGHGPAPGGNAVSAALNGSGGLQNIIGTPMYGKTLVASATQGNYIGVPSGNDYIAGAGAGGVAGTADATVEMSFLPPDRCVGITIYNSLGSKGRFIITYGNLATVNKQRDKDLTLYPKGR